MDHVRIKQLLMELNTIKRTPTPLEYSRRDGGLHLPMNFPWEIGWHMCRIERFCPRFSTPNGFHNLTA
jgi:hypothetical protein